MHKIKCIILTRYEGFKTDPITVHSCKEADQVFLQWAKTVPRIGYDKCGYVIYFDNGELYQGRYDLARKNNPCLEKYIVDFLKFASGRFKPTRLTQQQYQTILNRNLNLTKIACNYLDNYNFS